MSIFAYNEFPYGRVSVAQQGRAFRAVKDYVMGRKYAVYGKTPKIQMGRAVGYGGTRIRGGVKYTPGLDRRAGLYGRFSGRSVVNKERKYFDTSMSITFDQTAEVPATGGQLNLVPTGQLANTRIGRKFWIKSIQMRGTILHHNNGTTDNAGIAYMYLVLDKQCNGAAAGVSDVMTSTQLATARVKIENTDRFRIIKRWVFEKKFNAGVQSAWGDERHAVDWYKKCNILIDFAVDNTDGSLAGVKSNNLFMLAGSIQADDLITYSGYCRLRFED